MPSGSDFGPAELGLGFESAAPEAEDSSRLRFAPAVVSAAVRLVEEVPADESGLRSGTCFEAFAGEAAAAAAAAALLAAASAARPAVVVGLGFRGGEVIVVLALAFPAGDLPPPAVREEDVLFVLVDLSLVVSDAAGSAVELAPM